MNSLPEDGRPVVLELGCGDFANLPCLIAEFPEARVIGIEHPEIGQALSLAEKRGTQCFSDLLEKYHHACQAGALVWFLDFTQDLPESFADQVVVIAPDPAGVEGMSNRFLLAEAIVKALKPGGRLYLATERELLAEYLSQALLKRTGRQASIRSVTRQEIPYHSVYLDLSNTIYLVELA